MISLKMLLEDAFQEQVDKVYKEELTGFALKPSMFDRDALQLGVIYEKCYTDSFAMALAKAMICLAEDPHFYDDVDDYGKRDIDVTGGNQVTWTGHPGMPRLR
jgi:hypothetical protein